MLYTHESQLLLQELHLALVSSCERLVVEDDEAGREQSCISSINVQQDELRRGLQEDDQQDDVEHPVCDDVEDFVDDVRQTINRLSHCRVHEVRFV